MTSITEQYLQLIDEFIVAQARVKQTAADLIAIGSEAHRRCCRRWQFGYRAKWGVLKANR
jgi:hypothetical protein